MSSSILTLIIVAPFKIQDSRFKNLFVTFIICGTKSSEMRIAAATPSSAKFNDNIKVRRKKRRRGWGWGLNKIN